MSTRQRRLRRLLVAVAGVCLLPSAADAATHSGSVQMSGTTQGLRVKMSGTLRIKTNPQKGSFTCTMGGTSTQRGSQSHQGVSVKISGRSRIKATACRGSFDVATGRLRGKMTLRERGKVTMTARVPDEEGKMQTRRQTEDGGQTFDVALHGRIADGSGHGSANDKRGGSWSWRVSEVGGGAGIAPARPPKAGPTAPPTAARNPAKAAARGPAKEAARKPPADPAKGSARKPASSGKPTTATPEKRAEEAVRKGKPLRTALKGISDPGKRKKATRTFLQAKRAKVDRALRKSDKALKRARSKKKVTTPLKAAAKALAKAPNGPLKAAQAKKVDGAFKRGWGWLKSKFTGKAAASGGGKSLARVKKVVSGVQGIKEKVDQVVKIKRSIDKLNAQVKSGEISKDRGKVLKGGTLLGKALSKVVSYLPVFGKTASKVTQESFGVALKAGNKLAKHYTKTDCCIATPMADCCM